MDGAKPLLSLQIALQDDDGTDFVYEPLVRLSTSQNTVSLTDRPLRKGGGEALILILDSHRR